MKKTHYQLNFVIIPYTMNEESHPKLRAFFSVNLSSDTQAAVAQFIEGLKPLYASLKIHWTLAEKLHITVQFLGYIPKELVPSIIEDTTPIFEQQEPFELSFCDLTLFPTDHHPHALILYPKPSNSLFNLSLALQAPLLNLGLKLETRAYRPHLTLGKLHGNVRPDVSKATHPCIPTQWVTYCHLLESTPHEQTTSYRTVHTFQF